MCVHLHAVLGTPLVSFLADTVVDDDKTVKAQATDHGFGDAAARGHLRHAGLMAERVDDVGGGSRAQHVGVDEGYRRRGVLHQRLARQSCDDDLAEHGVLLLHDEVELCGFLQVDLSHLILMTQVAGLYADRTLWQCGEDIVAVCVGDGTLLDFWYGHDDADERFSVCGIGNMTLERRSDQRRVCSRCQAHDQA